MQKQFFAFLTSAKKWWITVQTEWRCKHCHTMTLVGSSWQNELAKSEKPNELAEQIQGIHSLGPPALVQQDWIEEHRV